MPGWIAQSRAQVFGHVAQRPEQVRENPPERRGDRVLGIQQVEHDLAVIGVDRHLDRVANVVDAAGRRRRIGVAGADGIGVLNPDQTPVGDRQVRITVVHEERRDPLHALGDAPIHEHPALGGEIR